jgi:hypothetical protein
MWVLDECDPLTDRRNLWVEKWSRDGLRVELMLYRRQQPRQGAARLRMDRGPQTPLHGRGKIPRTRWSCPQGESGHLEAALVLSIGA